MDRMLAIIIGILLAIAVFIAIPQNARPQTNNSNLNYERQSNQSLIDGYKADKNTYNTNPSSRADDGYNKWLNSQIERAQKDRDRAVNQQLQDRNRSGK